MDCDEMIVERVGAEREVLCFHAVSSRKFQTRETCVNTLRHSISSLE
jgi:hypothetical protein